MVEVKLVANCDEFFAAIRCGYKMLFFKHNMLSAMLFFLQFCEKLRFFADIMLKVFFINP